MTEDEASALQREKAVIRRRVRTYAREAGFVLNDDPRKLNMLLTGLARRKLRCGEFYCPCRVVTGDREKDRASICPCEAHLREIAQTGHCLCELFHQVEADEGKGEERGAPG